MKGTKMKQERFNAEIRNELKNRGMFLWELGPILGVSEPTVTRLMRKELSGEEKEEIIRKIREWKVTA